MYLPNLQSFISALDVEDDLLRIEGPIDPYLETAAYIDRVCKGAAGGRALLFENIKGSRLPLAANLFGSPRRVATALGVNDLALLSNRLRKDLQGIGKQSSEQGLAQLVDHLCDSALQESSAPCFAVDASAEGLAVLPVLHSWPLDGGAYLTLGQVITRAPDSHQQNCGMYRLQIIDKETALLRCHPGSGGSKHLRAWATEGKPMPVAIVLGGPPALTWCAGVSLPERVTEFAFASYLLGVQLPLAPCQTSDLLVPAEAEIVIEGHVTPGELLEEGPFANHSGYYSEKSLAPVVRIDAIHMRQGAIYPCTVVGPPPMENVYLAQAVAKLYLPMLQHDIPWIADLHMPVEGIYHRAAMLAVDDAPGSLRELSEQLWQTRFLRNSRLIIILDRGIALREGKNVYWKVVNAAHWEHSVLIENGRMVIDARAGRGKKAVSQDPQILKNLAKHWPDLGL